MQTNTNKVGTAVPAVRLEFDYDYMSRRTGKTVYEWNVASNDCQEASDSVFLYDACNLISEGRANSPSEPPSSTNFYVFGLDLSGSLQNAGVSRHSTAGATADVSRHSTAGATADVSRHSTAGALADVSRHSTAGATADGVGGLLPSVGRAGSPSTPVLYTYDANGNVSEILDIGAGTPSSRIAAHYEYSPFGETIVATGDLAKDNPFRFSTKYTDNETSFLYYGYRYYNPSTGKWLSNDPLLDPGSVPVMIAKRQLLGMLEANAGFWESLALDETLPDEIRFQALYDLLNTGEFADALIRNEPVYWLFFAGNNSLLFCANNPIDFFDPLGLTRIIITESSGNSQTFVDPTVSQFINYLRQLNETEQTIKIMSILGHGWSDTMSINKSDSLTVSTGGSIFIGEEDVTELLQSIVSKDTFIDLEGCRTGRGKDSVAQQLSRRLQGVTVRGTRNFTISLYEIHRFRTGIPLRIRLWRDFVNGKPR
ncbi:MAG: RHS repeat-associated core domain-containing protein [Lentisphaerae bacterium]|nr:RHS repeat-associated core domain-containing protein [Lentisphaerota bacterium]